MIFYGIIVPNSQLSVTNKAGNSVSKVRSVFKDFELWMIIIFNCAILYGYYNNNASSGEIILMYFIQNLFIGFQTFIRMFAIGWNHRITFWGKQNMSFFFAFHFGFFHFVYLIFLISMLKSNIVGFNYPLFKSAVIFIFVGTLYSLFGYIKHDKLKSKSQMGIMFTPYLRVVPVHLLILLGFTAKANSDKSALAFTVFIVLKMLGDVILHILVDKPQKNTSLPPKITPKF